MSRKPHAVRDAKRREFPFMDEDFTADDTQPISARRERRERSEFLQEFQQLLADSGDATGPASPPSAMESLQAMWSDALD